MCFLSFQHQVVFASTSQPFLYLIEKTSLHGMPLISPVFKFKSECSTTLLTLFATRPGGSRISAVTRFPMNICKASPCFRECRPPSLLLSVHAFVSILQCSRLPGAASGYLHPPLAGSACGHPSHPRMGARTVFANLEGACGVPWTCLSSPTDSLPGVLL